MTNRRTGKSSSSWARETRKFAAHALDLELNSRAGRFNFISMLIAAVVSVVFIVLDRETEIRVNGDEGLVAQFGGSDTSAIVFIGLLFLFILLFMAGCMVIITLVDKWHSSIQRAEVAQEDVA